MAHLRSSIPDNSVLHVLNRGNERRELFVGQDDYRRFTRLLARTQREVSLRLLAYALMPNHWHLVVWPETSNQLSQFMHRLCWQHAAELRHRTDTTGNGHVYQGRFRAFVIGSPMHYRRVMRYVEANPVRAGLVSDARAWRWSSLQERLHERCLICDGPEALPPIDHWLDEVNRPMTPEEVTQARWRRGR